MKKVVLALAVVAAVANLSSCSKSCTCTTYIEGEIFSITQVSADNLKVGMKCKDLTDITITNNKKSGRECF